MYLSALSRYQVEVLQAFRLEQGSELFAAHPDIALVVMDGCVNNKENKLDSRPLVREMRAISPSIPMIAASSDSSYRKRLMEAGCDHEAEKEHVVSKIAEILGLQGFM